MKKIIHWTIKYAWDDGTEEYVADIPDYVAKYVDEFLNSLELSLVNCFNIYSNKLTIFSSLLFISIFNFNVTKCCCSYPHNVFNFIRTIFAIIITTISSF